MVLGSVQHTDVGKELGENGIYNTTGGKNKNSTGGEVMANWESHPPLSDPIAVAAAAPGPNSPFGTKNDLRLVLIKV